MIIQALEMLLNVPGIDVEARTEDRARESALDIAEQIRQISNKPHLTEAIVGLLKNKLARGETSREKARRR